MLSLTGLAIMFVLGYFSRQINNTITDRQETKQAKQRGYELL